MTKRNTFTLFLSFTRCEARVRIDSCFPQRIGIPSTSLQGRFRFWSCYRNMFAEEYSRDPWNSTLQWHLQSWLLQHFIRRLQRLDINTIFVWGILLSLMGSTCRQIRKFTALSHNTYGIGFIYLGTYPKSTRCIKWKINFYHKFTSNLNTRNKKKTNSEGNITWRLILFLSKRWPTPKNTNCGYWWKQATTIVSSKVSSRFFYRGKYFGQNSLFLLSPSPYFFLVF